MDIDTFLESVSATGLRLPVPAAAPPAARPRRWMLSFISRCLRSQ